MHCMAQYSNSAIVIISPDSDNLSVLQARCTHLII